MKRLDVILGIPGPDVWDSKFALSVVGVVADFANGPQVFPGLEEQQLRVFHKKGSILPQLRQELVDNAIEAGATHIMFLDTDQTFPPNTLRRLLAWRLPVVACNIATKRFPSEPTARKQNETEQGEPVYTKADSEGLERVWRVGCGVMLVDLTVFAHIEKPWFMLRWHNDYGKFEGEDWYFCMKLEKAGYWIYVDHGLSQDIGHRGFFEYGHDSVEAGLEWKKARAEMRQEVSDSAEAPAVEGNEPPLIVVPNGALTEQLTSQLKEAV